MRRTTLCSLAVATASALSLALGACAPNTSAGSASTATSATGSDASSGADSVESAASATSTSPSSATSATSASALDPAAYVNSAEFVPGTPLLGFPWNDEGIAQLVSDMQAGKIPTSCNVLFDQSGGLPDVEVSDPETVSKIFGLMGEITIEGASNMSVTDSYHHVIFTLQSGDKIGFQFEGAGNLVGAKTNFAVLGDAPLWTFVRQLQNEKTGAAAQAAGGSHRIIAADNAEAIHGLPERAVAGEAVSFTVDDFTDVDLEAYIGSAYGSQRAQREGNTFTFTMPDGDAYVHLAFRAYPGGGA